MPMPPPPGHPLPWAILHPSKPTATSNPLEAVALKKPPPVQMAQVPAPQVVVSARSRPSAIQSENERHSPMSQYPEQVPSNKHLGCVPRPTPAGQFGRPLPTEEERVKQMQSQSILALAERMFTETEREQMYSAAASRLAARSAVPKESRGEGGHAVTDVSIPRQGEGPPDASESSADSFSRGAVSRRGRRDSKRSRNR